MKFTGYVDKNSILHRTEPRVKILWFMTLTLLVVLYRNLHVLCLLLAGCIITWVASKLYKEVLGLLKRLSPLLIMAFLTWVFIGSFESNNPTALFSFGDVLAIEAYDLEKAIVSTIRIFLMVSVFYTLIMTTDFSELITGLRKLGIPYRAAFMVGLVFQIMPIMISEFQTIANAQRSRGLELDKGTIIVRIKNYSTILFPLFIRSIQMGQNISLSMYLYKLDFSKKRSSFKDISLSKLDVQFCFFFILLYVSAVFVGIIFQI